MIQKIGHFTLFVRDYEEAKEFYTGKLGFKVITDKEFGPGYRWLTVAPQGTNETAIVLIKADDQESLQAMGRQSKRFVMMTIITDDCRRDYEELKARGVKFQSEPDEVPHGIEVVFEDLYGNLFDLVQPSV